MKSALVKTKKRGKEEEREEINERLKEEIGVLERKSKRREKEQ